MLPPDFFKMMADETRLRLLLLIARNGELSVTALTEALNESQPKISRHLAKMRENKLLVTRRQHQLIFYSVNTAIPGWMAKVVDGLRHSKCLLADYKDDQSRLFIK